MSQTLRSVVTTPARAGTILHNFVAQFAFCRGVTSHNAHVNRLIVLDMTLRLKAAGYDVFIAFDGQQGIDSAVENQLDA